MRHLIYNLTGVFDYYFHLCSAALGGLRQDHTTRPAGLRCLWFLAGDMFPWACLHRVWLDGGGREWAEPIEVRDVI